MKKLLIVLLVLGLSSGGAGAATTTVSGTIVNVAAYVTGDASATTFNMGAMMGSGYGGMMGGSYGGMMGGYGGNGYGRGMYGCRSALGLVTSRGDLYLLVLDAPSSNVFGLCSDIGSRVTVQGTVFQKSGLRAIRVDTVGS